MERNGVRNGTSETAKRENGRNGRDNNNNNDDKTNNDNNNNTIIITI